MDTSRFVRVIAIGAVVAAAPAASAQDDASLVPARQPEAPNMPPGPVLPRVLSAPAHAERGSGFSYVQVNVDPATGMNIVGDAANEPSIAVDPTAPNRIAIGWRQFDTIASDHREAGYSFSTDGGRTWAGSLVFHDLFFHSDPVLDATPEGVFLYLSLRVVIGSYICEMWESTDGGATWTRRSPAQGGDKSWFAIDKTPGLADRPVYQAWNTAGNTFFPRQFNRSLDTGFDWTYPTTFDPQENVRPTLGTLAVGVDRELYVVGVPNTTTTGTCWVLRSDDARDGGVEPPTFSVRTVSPGGGTFVQRGGSNSPNPGGLISQIWVRCDTGDGPRRGNVYVMALVRNTFPGSNARSDIAIYRSTNGGQTFSGPFRVNDGPLGQQAWRWFAAFDVAPSGRLDAVWFDTRNDPSQGDGTFLSQLFYSSSADGGTTWSPSVALTPLFDSHIGWPVQNKIGDYIDIVSDATGAGVCFPATFGGEQDMYYVRIGDRDCDGNSVPDADDLLSGALEDCDGDGVPDVCAIAAGAAQDNNGNGVPDGCEPCAADWNGDGGVNTADFFEFFSAFFADPPDADFNGDGVTDSADFFEFFAAFFGPPC